MTEFLYRLDVWFLYFINHTLSNPLFNRIFPFITEVKNWYIAYLILFLLLIFKGGRTGRIAALFLIILIIATDQFSSSFLKNFIQRVRPCNTFGDLNVLVTCTDSFSFPSSHAVNNFGVAVYFSKIFPRYKIPFLTVASLMAFSRPYVGVHYPSDVLGGMLIGSLIGYLFSLIVLQIDSRFFHSKDKITDKYERIKFR